MTVNRGRSKWSIGRRWHWAARWADIDAVHILRAPPADDTRGQTLDIWLAPSLEWYPVRLRFTEGEDFVEQQLSKITKR